MSPPATGGVDVVHAYLHVMNRLDLDAFAGLVTDDVVVALPYAPDPVPRHTAGREAVVGLYGGFPSLVSPLGFHDVAVRPLGARPDGTGEDFLATYRSDATMLATGRPYRNDYISLFTVRDGKLAGFTEYFDPLVFRLAQGATVTGP